MEKFLRFFLLNKKVRKGQAGTLLTCLGKYIGVWIALVIVQAVLNRIPLLKNLSYNLLIIYQWYMVIGSILALVQFASNLSYENVVFYEKEDVLHFVKSKQYVKAKATVGIGLLVLCLIPHGGYSAKTVKQTVANSTKEEMQESAEQENTQMVQKEVQEAEEMEHAETAPVVTQEQKEFYEKVKGFWKGDDIDYAFIKWKDDYVFVNSDSYGDAMTNEDFYIAFYTVEKFEQNGDEFKATLRDKEEKVYLLEYIKSKSGINILKIKEETQEDWQMLTDNNCASYEEFLANVGYSFCWLELSYFDYKDNVMPYVASFKVNEKDKYCLLDVTEQYEGKELLLCNSDTITVLTDSEGFVRPIYRTYSFKNLERYEPEKKTLWAYYDGGTSGPSFYTCETYDEECGGWRTEEHDAVSEISYIQDNCESVFFSPLGEDYEAAYAEELERQEKEAQAKADATITFDESMVITEPVESYIGTFYNQTFPLEITEISEDMVTLKIITGQDDSMHSIGLGKRVLADDIPEGMAVYSVAGLVLTDTHGNSINANYAVMLVLKPDGAIFIKNIDELKPEFELPEGTYRRKEESD